MYILGISCYYHDSSVCIVKDGVLLSAVEEERFTRIKHDFSFPIHSIQYCLKQASITMDQVDYVALYEKPLLKFERILSQHLQCFPKSFLSFYLAIPSWVNEKLKLKKFLKKRTGYKKDIFYVPHHLAHAASSFFVSPFEDAAIVTIDGVGEWQTTTFGYGSGTEIKLLKQITFPHSIGLLYSAITAYLGYKVNDHEYKVMGLAAYGKPVYTEKLKKVIDIKDDGSFFFDMSYFRFLYKISMFSKKFLAEFGPSRKKDSAIEKHHMDMAASIQKLLEESIMKMLCYIYEVTKKKNICLAGGVALNSCVNGKILKNTPFENLYILPAAGDGGGSVGAAFYAYNGILQNKRIYVLDSANLGPSYSGDEIKEYLDSKKIKYTILKSDEELVKRVARLIYENSVIGWFQGRMEYGPRALGARSILSNPCNPSMKDILNLKVKHREVYRPFAPVVCIEDAKDYFEVDDPLPLACDFMLMVYPILPDKRKSIPAVVHQDGSGRLQTIRRKQNPLYYDLIKEFGKISGVPVLINTSFNIRGEPIVCTPQDAYRCMMGTGIDYLVMDRFLIKRSDNPQDMWDSEKVAKD